MVLMCVHTNWFNVDDFVGKIDFRYYEMQVSKFVGVLGRVIIRNGSFAVGSEKQEPPLALFVVMLPKAHLT